MITKEKITQSKLKDLVNYDIDTGKFTWKISVSGRKIGGKVGTFSKQSGYINIQIDKITYRAHRLVWMYIYGKFPEKQIDHINGIRDDNRLCNLREATPQQNAFNRRKQNNNTCGYRGVTFDKDANKFMAQIKFNGIKRCIGRYEFAIDASDAYETYAKNVFGEFYKNIEEVS